MEETSTMKKCTGCREEFPATLEFFYKAKNGLRGECKKCKRSNSAQRLLDNPGYDKRRYENNREQQIERAKAWKKANKEHYAEYQKQWKKNNPEKRRAADTKRRALKKGATVGKPFGPNDVLDKWGMDCHICKTPIDIDNWHMEHVHPLAKGGSHTLENVKPSHPLCNLQKGAK